MRHLSPQALVLSAVLLGCSAVLPGCEPPVPALNPLYLPGDVIADSSLVGEWDDDELYRIEFVGERRLRIQMRDYDGAETSVTFSAFALELGGARFIDLFTDPAAGTKTLFSPVHFFFRYRTTPDSLFLSWVKWEDWSRRLAAVGEAMAVIECSMPEPAILPEGVDDPEGDCLNRILPHVTESLQWHVLSLMADTTVVWETEDLVRVVPGPETSGGAD